MRNRRRRCSRCWKRWRSTARAKPPGSATTRRGRASLHPSAPVVPAAFAIGELVGASGREVLTAIVAGYEVCCRLGNALDPTSHYARGFHPTATAGTYGAAAAASKLFGLSQDQIVAAFGVSGSQAAGSLQFLVNGAWNKRHQGGAAAMNGVIAATLARHEL